MFLSRAIVPRPDTLLRFCISFLFNTLKRSQACLSSHQRRNHKPWKMRCHEFTQKVCIPVQTHGRHAGMWTVLKPVKVLQKQLENEKQQREGITHCLAKRKFERRLKLLSGTQIPCTWPWCFFPLQFAFYYNCKKLWKRNVSLVVYRSHFLLVGRWREATGKLLKFWSNISGYFFHILNWLSFQARQHIRMASLIYFNFRRVLWKFLLIKVVQYLQRY